MTHFTDDRGIITRIEVWDIKELCRGKKLAEINSFQHEVKEFYALLKQLKVLTRAFGVYLLTGDCEIFFSLEIAEDELTTTKIEAKKEAMRVARMKIQQFLAGEFVMHGRGRDYDPLQSYYSFSVDDTRFHYILEQLKVFDIYPHYQAAINRSIKSVYLLLIDPHRIREEKAEILEDIHKKARDIMYRVYYVINEQQGWTGYIIKAQNEYYTQDMVKKDMEYLLDLYLKILKGELTEI